MDNSVILGLMLVVASIFAGLYYCVIGIAALRHLPDASEVDKVIGWTLWWFLEKERYNAEGKRLCNRGAAMFFIACLLAIPGYYLLLRK